ncbi:MAG: GYF domain-containing protein [Verrucomicrobiota bacterium]
MQWFYAKNSLQHGPVSDAELRGKLATGEISPLDLVWREGMGNWTPMAQVAEFGLMPGGPTASAYPAYAAGCAVPQIPPGKAVTSMILGICSLVIGFSCFPFSLLVAVPCAIVGIVLGSQYRRAAKESPEMAHDQVKAVAGIITSWIALGLSLLLTALIVFFIVFAVWSEKNNGGVSSGPGARKIELHGGFR